MTFLSPNHRCQSNERNSKTCLQSAKITHGLMLLNPSANWKLYTNNNKCLARCELNPVIFVWMPFPMPVKKTCRRTWSFLQPLNASLYIDITASRVPIHIAISLCGTKTNHLKHITPKSPFHHLVSRLWSIYHKTFTHMSPRNNYNQYNILWHQFNSIQHWYSTSVRLLYVRCLRPHNKNFFSSLFR